MTRAPGGEPPTCPMEHDAVAWALRALEPDEELAMRSHLAGCRSCRATARETELVMGAVAGSVEQVDPPDRLRADILAGAAATPRAPREPRPDPAYAPEPGAGAGSGPDRGPADDRAPVQRRRWIAGRRRLVVAAVAAVAAVGGVVTYTAQVQQERGTQSTQAQSLPELLTELVRPGTSHATLDTDAGQAVAAVLITPSERTVVATGLDPNDRDHSVYVLWGVGPGGPLPLGMFDVTAPGPVVQPIGPAHGEPFTRYAVSLEPGRTMPATPTTVVASGAVQA